MKNKSKKLFKTKIYTAPTNNTRYTLHANIQFSKDKEFEFSINSNSKAPLVKLFKLLSHNSYIDIHDNKAFEDPLIYCNY